jgi:hypothetical protein
LTQAWSLRETDLFDLQKPLFAIDDARVDGKFVGQDGTAPHEGQSVSRAYGCEIGSLAYHFVDPPLPLAALICPCLHSHELQRGKWLISLLYQALALTDFCIQPVSEALTPIFNQLQTVQRCLKEVQKFGISSPRDLYPYSMKVCNRSPRVLRSP